MADILLFSDLHIHPHKSSLKRLQDCLDVLKWVFETARQENIKDIIFCGDLFQNRFAIQTLAYYLTFQVLESYQDIRIVLLEGNHDLWFHERLDVSSVKPLGALPNVTVIAEPCTFRVSDLDVDFLPFTHNPLEVVQKNFKKKSRVMCGHVAVDGAELNKMYSTKAEVSVEVEKDMVRLGVDVFYGWEKVFLGHYHGEQKLNDRVEYLGSPLQLNFSEAFQRKHIAIMDAETLDVRYIENTFSPKHLIIPYSEISKYDLNNNFVQIQLDDVNTIDILEAKNQIKESTSVQTLEFKQVKNRDEKVKQNDVQDKFNLAKGDILERYLKTIGCGNLDETLLMKIGKNICQENNEN